MADKNLYGIIGVGRFGLAVAQELINAGKTIIAIDIHESKLDPLRHVANNLYKVNKVTKETLVETGIADCSTVVITIGNDIEANILVTMNVLELGVPRVISKAYSVDHGRVLQKLGAEVVYPEVDMGHRLGMSLSLKAIKDITPLSDSFSIVESAVGNRLINCSVINLRLRERYNINVITVIRNEKVLENFGPDTILQKHDIIVYAGTNKAIQQFQAVNAERD